MQNLVFMAFILICLFTFLGNSTNSSLTTLDAESRILVKYANDYIRNREKLYDRTKGDLYLGVLD